MSKKNTFESRPGTGPNTGAGIPESSIAHKRKAAENTANDKKAIVGVLAGVLLAAGLVSEAPAVIKEYTFNSTYELPETSLADVIGERPDALNGTLVVGSGAKVYAGLDGITSNSGYDQGESVTIPEGKSLVLSRPITTVDSEGNEFYFGRLMDSSNGTWIRVESNTEGLNYVSAPEGLPESVSAFVNGNVVTDGSRLNQLGRTAYVLTSELNDYSQDRISS